ncbi:putative aldouronate transport system substrate-binding protein [Paenibacillus castaneae]|uniref:extracellular solute-binding protein n=1 Tax=Paenibacillus castaneae TaxID=474957 RepID=UPI000C9AB324|nr:extracellular solute-binding protein [Paenibacillus castaneae]NIK78072.1 putative aldouronate transport system substrate-binding protein [Paenibacillus castaneae]
MLDRPKKSLMVLLILILSFSVFTACSKETNSNNAGQNSSPEASKAPEAVTEDNFSKGKFDPPVTITTSGCTNSAYVFKNGETLENNVHTKWAKDRLGIDIKYNWVTADDQCSTKIRLALSSGERLPDVMRMHDQNLINDLIEADKLMDITSAFDQYASEELKAIYNQDPSYWYGAARDGKKYGIPILNFSLQNDPLMWVRQDWLEQLNLQAPTTFDELEVVMDAFIEANLGNVKKPVGMAVGIKNGYATWMSDASWIFGGYGVIPGYWNKWNGASELQYGSIRPEAKEALAKMNEWYNKGYISPDAGLSDESKASELFTNGSSGFIFGPMWMAGWPMRDVLQQNNPDAKYKAYPVPSGPSGKSGLHGSPIPDGALMISKDFKHIDALILYLNTLAAGAIAKDGEFMYGWHEDYDYTMIDGKPSYNGDDVPGGQVYPEKYFLMQAPLDPYHELNLMKKIANNEPIDSPRDQVTAENIKTDEAARIRYETDLMAEAQKDRGLHNLYTGAATKTLLEKGEALKKIEGETFSEIIYGKAPIDNFDSFVKKWSDLGGVQLTSEVNDWYKSVGGK